jgi:hypothetical protein
MLIFLDIDGVMVPANSWKRPEFLNDGFPTFSHKATQALQKIISETSADIILTTSHKSTYSITEWYNIFNNRGININNINRLPGNSAFLNRNDEILNWFNYNNMPKNFVIIDDDRSLNALPKHLKDKLILTSPLIGLTNDLAIDAISILDKTEKYTYA